MAENDLGFKETFREKILEPLWAYRGLDSAGSGPDISMDSYMKDVLHLTNAHGNDLTKEDIWRDYGRMPWETTVNMLIQTKTDHRFLWVEEIRDMLFEGTTTDGGADPYYQDLCMIVGEPVNSQSVVTPKVVMEQTAPAEVYEGQTIPKSTIGAGEKSIPTGKKARMVEITDEAAKSCTVNLFRPLFREFGNQITMDDNDHCVTVLHNGDQIAGGDEAIVIGVETPGTLAYDDIDYIWIVGSEIGQRYFTFLSNRTMAQTIRKLAEFRESAESASPKVKLHHRNNITPGDCNHIITPKLSDPKIMFVNRDKSTRQVLFMPLGSEDVRYPERMVGGFTVYRSTGYENVNKKARLVLDITKDRATYDFPADWLRQVQQL